MGLERVLLHSLKFDLHVALPYDALLDYKMMFPDMNREKVSKKNYFSTIITCSDFRNFFDYKIKHIFRLPTPFK